jgi:ADP-ribose pyrophosphatase YjhB (NUDIX family)
MIREYPDRPVVGVGAVIWRGEQVLLIRRGRPPRLGQWSLPGGAQHLGETLEEAIRREVREETGLGLTSLRFLTTVDLIDRDPEGRVRYHYTLVDFTAEAADGDPVPGDDAAAVAWVLPDQLAGLGLWAETIRIISESRQARHAARAG